MPLPAHEPYWRGNAGLTRYARKFDVSHAVFWRQARRNAARCAALTGKLSVVDSATSQIRDLCARFAALQPMLNDPSVYSGGGTP